MVALALAPVAATRSAVARARATVTSMRRADGWGYNGATASDADTTSFALRLVGGDASVLDRYVDDDGHAHTFMGTQFGSWAWAHADVTATVGIALTDAGEDATSLREAALRDVGAWRSFWWTTDVYAVARTLELLDVTGGIPPAVTVAARRWVAAAAPAATAFEAALLLDVATLIGAMADPRLEALRAFRCDDGGWPPSAVLLTPSQLDGTPGAPHADRRRLLTTATALAALRRCDGIA